MKKAKIVFRDSTYFEGRVFAQGDDRVGEVIFNTAMSGYQEVLTDPSYAGQIVVLTYPMAGNYGVNPEDIESKKLHLQALVVREYVDHYSNWRATQSLKSYLEEHGILGITDVDTRALTKYIREKGAQQALITTSSDPVDQIAQDPRLKQSMTGASLAKTVTTPSVYTCPAVGETKYKVAVIDCGVKTNITRLLNQGGCQCDVYPMNATPEEILNQGYDGIMLSNGPGDPEPLHETISLIRAILGKIPVYGICLGHQLLSLALKAKTYKLKFGHHGANHPVMDLKTGKVEITSQNHGFAVSPDGLDRLGVTVTHRNLNDQTVSGIENADLMCASVQYHPEASPGPHDSYLFFEQFYRMMDVFKHQTTKTSVKQGESV